MKGLNLATSTELKPGAFVVLRFELPEKDSHLFARPGDRTIHINLHVKWCHERADGSFSVGAEIFMMLDGTEEPLLACLLRGLEGVRAGGSS